MAERMKREGRGSYKYILTTSRRVLALRGRESLLDLTVSKLPDRKRLKKVWLSSQYYCLNNYVQAPGGPQGIRKQQASPAENSHCD